MRVQLWYVLALLIPLALNACHYRMPVARSDPACLYLRGATSSKAQPGPVAPADSTGQGLVLLTMPVHQTGIGYSFSPLNLQLYKAYGLGADGV